ncbi:PD-(D/E)XK nuclease family protein [Palleronia sp. KMU-117]|uniref:PD-(D/E)XK nuclease family protein n=1 Tax=Palleronia sp. KMU-117 TaxID=3434108 RepID=UPI003D7252FD
MRLDPLLTCSPQTGAIRPVTPDLLRDVYLAPRWADWSLREALNGRPAPWTESLAAAPEATTAAVEMALVAVMKATSALDPAELRPEALKDGRARTHLIALRDLWRDLKTLPPPFDTISHVLRCEARDALEPVPVLDPALCPHADSLENALQEHLGAHHGIASEAALDAWRTRQALSDGRAPGALGAIQRGLGRSVDTVTRDRSLSVFGLRDPREEAEFAAARAQALLADDIVAAPSELGVLAPDDPAYTLALSESFDRLGLPLSGLPATPARRDAAGEIMSALLAVLQGPAPRTALATFYSHPAMPWSRATGRQMAREVIDRGWSQRAQKLREEGMALLDALRPVSSPEQLVARLFSMAEALPALDLAPRIGALRAAIGDTLDWPAIRRLAAPSPAPAEGADRYVEGVSLFTETALPWRPVRHLIVLGMAGRSWPRLPAANPFFTESEIAQIRDATGISLRGRREHLARGLELFRRQLCAASEGLTLTVPARDLRGEVVPPSVGLALISHLLGAKDPEDLLVDLRAHPPEDWPVGHVRSEPVPGGGAPATPAEALVHLGSDLLRVRESGEGRHVPQSPSRLETLLVSPLAWLLDELEAKDRSWVPETLDVMTLGSVMHKVIEHLFPEGAPVPEDLALRSGLSDALDTAIRAEAPWLAGPDWTAERASLRKEAETTVLAWARFLKSSGAEVLHNEIDLAGDYGGLLIRGRADCVLRLPDGRVLVVDHKRSRANGRRERMSKGWDLQVALYRAMLERPIEDTALTDLVRAGARPVTAYHTMLDGTVMVDADGTGIAGAEAATSDISESALELLAERVKEVGGGTIRLNGAGDLKRFAKDCGITAYALKQNSLVAAFLVPEAEDQMEAEE